MENITIERKAFIHLISGVQHTYPVFTFKLLKQTMSCNNVVLKTLKRSKRKFRHNLEEMNSMKIKE